MKAQSSKAWYLLCLAEENGIYKLSRAGISKGCDFEGSVEQSMVFIVFSIVFTSSVELVFRSHCDFEGSVEQSRVFTVFSMAFTSSVELAFRSHCDFEGLVEQSVVFTVFSTMVW